MELKKAQNQAKRFIPDYLLDKINLLGTMVFTVIFATLFLSIFVPMTDRSWFYMSSPQYFLYVVAFILIVIGFLALSRVLMFKSKGWFKMNYFGYVMWCIAEVLIIAFIYTIVSVMALGDQSAPPTHILGLALLYVAFSLAIPYTFAGMYFSIVDKNRTIVYLSNRGMVTGLPAASTGDERITLYDSSGALKLVVKSSNLFYIESDDNYIKVWYRDSKNQVQTNMIRCRLKSIEDTFKDSFLVRCSRKCIVNIDNVKILTKEGENYNIDMGVEEIKPIVVTKSYHQDVLSRFSAKK